jgi:signal transduction histidine kinase
MPAVLGRSEAIPWTPEEIGLLEAFVREAANEIESAPQKDAGELAKPGKIAGRLNPVDHELLTDIIQSFRNPIAAIKAVSANMLPSHDGRTPEMCQKLLQTIVDESDRLDRAVLELIAPAEMDP